MTTRTKRLETMLFNYETATRTDFRQGEIKPLTKTLYVGKVPCKRLRPAPLKDISTLIDWRVPNVPFDLFGRPKEVIRTHPNDLQKPYLYPPDVERKQVQMSRPRLVMTPAGRIDDLCDKERQVLIDDAYTTTSQKASRESTELVALGINNIKAPLPETYAPTIPISLEKLNPPYVSPEWRMDSVSWDNRQLRTHCQPTKTFWLLRSPPYCSECEEAAARVAIKRMRRR